jgi:probable addiction module antidote protein
MPTVSGGVRPRITQGLHPGYRSLESGNAAYVAWALGVIARARGMSEVAREAGLTREARYRSLCEAGDPLLSTLLRVMRALGVRLVVGWGDSVGAVLLGCCTVA